MKKKGKQMTQFELNEKVVFLGISKGKHCGFEARVVQVHPSMPNTYQIEATAANNVWYEPDHWISGNDIRKAF